MSNADDNQGRRGLFRRNRPTEPVASAPLSDTETQNADTAAGESLPDADRKQARRPGLGRRKPAADGSWSSDAWEDGWDDDWSDRSSRAGVRPAADPRPAEVDAWLASSDDQLGDITRDIARKWTGNKQTEPITAAITWADDVPAAPSRSFVEDPFADDPFADQPRSGRLAEPASSFASDDDLWDTPAASSDWGSTPNDASDLIDFADNDLPVVPRSTTPINLGSTWDDDEPVVAAVAPVEHEPKAIDEPATAAPDSAEPAPEVEAEIVSSFVAPELSAPVTFPSDRDSSTSGPTETATIASGSVDSFATSPALIDSDSVALDSVEMDSVDSESFHTKVVTGAETLNEQAFDFAGTTPSADVPEPDSLKNSAPPSTVDTELGSAVVTEFEARPLADAQELDTTVAEALALDGVILDVPPVETPTAEIPVTDTPLLGVDHEQTLIDAAGNVAEPAPETPLVQTQPVQPHLGTFEIPETIESVLSTAIPSESTVDVASASIEQAAEPELLIPAAPEVPEPFAAAAGSVAQVTADQITPEQITPEQITPAQTTSTQITSAQPVERDEFLDSLYEELDDDDVPAQRKMVQQETSAQFVAPVATEVEPFAPRQVITDDAVKPVEAVEAVAETPRVDLTRTDLTRTDPALSSVESAAEEVVDFAPSNTDFDRRVTEAPDVPSAEPTIDSATSPLVPQDPNADFDFGPDRPVYAPKGSPAIAPAIVAAPVAATTAASQNPVVQQDDDDLFPATKADRFGAALDQLDDDQTDPSGLQGLAKKGFLRGRKNRKALALEAEPLSAAISAELDEQTDLPVAPRTSAAAALEPTISSDTLVAATATATTAKSSALSPLRDERTKPANQNFDAPENEDDLGDLDEYDDDDLDDYPEEAYFSPKLTKLLARAGFLLVALAAIRMLVLVGLAVRDGATDGQGIQDVFHRIGSAFAELGLAHGLMLIVGIAMAAAPALLGDPYIDDESRSIGATFGIGLIAAIFGVFGGFAAARLAMRVNDIADLTNPGVSSTTKWAKLAMNLVATAGLSLVAVVAAVRALGGDRPEQD